MSTHAKVSIKQEILNMIAAAGNPPTVAAITNHLRDKLQAPMRSAEVGGYVQSLVSSGYLKTIKNPQDSRAANVYTLDRERTKRPLLTPQAHQIRSDSIKSKILDVMHAIGKPVTSRDVQEAMGEIPIAVAMVLSTMARMEMIVPIGIVRVRRHDEPTKTTPMMSYACNPNFNEAGGGNKRARMGDPEKMWRVLLDGVRFENVKHGPVGQWRGNGSGETQTLTGSQGAMCAGL